MVVTGWSLHLPGVDVAATVNSQIGSSPGSWACTPAVGPAHARDILGRKGLLYKEPATRLALCAVHRALDLPPGKRPTPGLQPRTAVVATSNLGNVATVAQVARDVYREGHRAVSVLDAPNVSSNVIASTVALWFGFGGPNIMVCSGATAGLDGLSIAHLLLRARRADRVVLVGAEPDDDVATAVHGRHPPLRAGAACLILQAGNRPADHDRLPAAAHLYTVPHGGAWPLPPRLVIGPTGFDTRAHWGDLYGASGVVGLALAAHLAVDDGHRIIGVHDTGEGASRAAIVAAVAPHQPKVTP
ncbi:beta-ketoacyl synthase N-terminal-like domain-containing protein [Micromonospora sediminicola]|uniref:beta-ketoacyl synthase N-terminal-like domain-containing protein n=1 Tax=Micromonospora sediminicola TaxID=946078 RepID=UPI00340E9103